MKDVRLPFVFLLLVALFFSGCAPSLSPLYRDFAVPASDSLKADARIAAALKDAGWEVASMSTPNTITTQERTISHWGIYRVDVSLEIVPVGPTHVRVLFHPYRKFFTGNRSKIPYMAKRLQRRTMPQVARALQSHGLTYLATASQRDRRIAKR